MNGSLYWITESLPGLLWFALVYGLLGLPAALFVLPRRQWSDRAAVGALAIAFAPALLTLWLFVLGTLGAALNTPLMTPAPMLIGCGVMALALWGGVWRKWPTPLEARAHYIAPLRNSDKTLVGLLLCLLVIAVFLRWITTAYWPFTGYDTLWVYGYQGRLYALKGLIPTTIGYYPPFISLQYASAQILFGINDHAARMTIPFLHIGGILAAYLLGRGLFGRRAGWVLAALWGLYPHVGAWAQIGDLEIPLAFLVTLFVAFFLQAWREAAETTNRRAALTAGLVLGIALWTKPTAGAFVWGVGLLVLVEFVRTIVQEKGKACLAPTESQWPVFRRRFMIAVYTGVACAPLGGLWYVRNLLLGHHAVDFPPSSWLTKATRSGDLLGWLLVGLLVLLIANLIWRRPQRETLILGIGTALITLGAVPSMPWYAPLRVDPPLSYISLAEGVLIGIGGLLLAGLLLYRWFSLSSDARSRWATIGAALLLALPYFMTWFFSYSYHYRLSFAIVPLMLLPLAALLGLLWPMEELKTLDKTVDARLIPKSVSQRWRIIFIGAVVIFLAIAGITSTITDAARDQDWLWVDRYPDDSARYREHVPEMMLLRDTFEAYKRDNGRIPVIIAPGEQRLQFFYPELTIISNTVPTRLDELAGATHYIYGTQPEWRYQDEHLATEQNQIVAALGRKDLMYHNLSYDDGIFRYEVYEIHLEARETPALTYLTPLPHQVDYGGVVAWTDYAVSNGQFGNTIFADLAFRVIKRPTQEMTLRLSFVEVATGKVVYTMDTCIAPNPYGCYRAPLWDEGETMITSLKIIGDSDAGDFPRGDYALRLEFVGADGQSLSVTVDGVSQASYDLPGFHQ